MRSTIRAGLLLALLTVLSAACAPVERYCPNQDGLNKARCTEPAGDRGGADLGKSDGGSERDDRSDNDADSHGGDY